MLLLLQQIDNPKAAQLMNYQMTTNLSSQYSTQWISMATNQFISHYITTHQKNAKNKKQTQKPTLFSTWHDSLSNNFLKILLDQFHDMGSADV